MTKKEKTKEETQCPGYYEVSGYTTTKERK